MGFGFGNQGLKANPAESVGFGCAAWGLRANPAESDLVPWWVFGFAAWGLGGKHC